MSDEEDRQDLEDRVDQLESTIAKMLPGRRDALKLGGAALVGGAAMSGSASAGTNQAGTIGTSGAPVDVESEDINNADTVTTQDLVVNGTATGTFGTALESGDDITVASIDKANADSSFKQLYSGVSKDVLGGVVYARVQPDFLYEFSNNQTLTKNLGLGGVSYSGDNPNRARDSNDDNSEVDFLPPAKNVIRIEVGAQSVNQFFGAEVILKD